jgi:sugar fermentation stimulation protein A
MLWPKTLLPATFIRRENRFRAAVRLAGQVVPAHVPNSGRLGELFQPGAAVWVAPAQAGSQRKTRCDLTVVAYANTLVSIDSRLPNRLAVEALSQGRLSPFAGYPRVQAEVAVGEHSRLDLLLTGPEPAAQRCWLETKSVTLVEDGVALFPDAPTERGMRHLEELATLRSQGDRVAVLFVIQRSDARAFSPHPTAHPAFAATLRRVYSAGVEVHAWRCAVDLKEIVLTDAVGVLL